MFRWFTKLFQRTPPSRIIEIMVDGEIKRVAVQSVVGLGFTCTIPSSDGATRMRVIQAGQAVDPQHFWRLWRSMGGCALWPNGSEFRPDK